MVMNTEQELNEARTDFNRGYFGQPWDYRLSDEKWREARERSLVFLPSGRVFFWLRCSRLVGHFVPAHPSRPIAGPLNACPHSAYLD